MTVQNSLQKVPDKKITYQVNGEDVTLSPSIVRDYLTNGNGNVTDQEIVYFLNLCKYQKLNPLTKEVYLVKYGNQPATIITGKDALLKRAMRNPKYAGHQAGVVVRNNETKELEYRIGSLVLDTETLVGGWAKTFVKGFEQPIESSVSINEYIGFTKEGNVNSMWSSKPGTMIRKVALVTSLRESFPEDLGEMYDSSEMGVDFDDATGAPPTIDIPQEEQPQPVDEVEFEDLLEAPMDELEQF